MRLAALLIAFSLSACQTPTPTFLPQPTTSWPPDRAGNRTEELIEQHDEDIERETGEPFLTGTFCTRRGDWCVTTPGGEDIYLRLPGGSSATHPPFERQAETWRSLVRLHESDRVLIGLTFEQRRTVGERFTLSYELALYETSPRGEMSEVARMLLVSVVSDGMQRRELASQVRFAQSRDSAPVFTIETTASRFGRDQTIRTIDEACSYTRSLTRTAEGRYEFDVPPTDCPDYLPN